MKHIYFVLLLSILFGQCGDKNNIILKYDLTYCADKWQIDNNSSIEEQENTIEIYLKEEEGIVIERLNILENINPAEACNACTCKRGDVVEVEIDEVFELKLGELGFYE